MSIHEALVVEVNLEAHPNADALEIACVYGFTCCVRKGDFKNGDLAVYITPDTVVPVNRPEFSFLRDPRRDAQLNVRIKVKKLRGVISQGVLLHAPPGFVAGDNAFDYFGLSWYEPPLSLQREGEAEKPPGIYAPTYSIENWRRYKHLLTPGEEVLVTEKIHGASARYVWFQDRLWCGSRTEWKRESPGNLWWQAVEQNPGIAEFCKNHPGVVLYGEVFGQVQDLCYGAARGQLFFCGFDLLKGNNWLSASGIEKSWFSVGYLKWAPILYIGPYSEEVEKLSEGPSLWGGCPTDRTNIREGAVIQPIRERTCPEIGRVKLKIVSDEYLSR